MVYVGKVVNTHGLKGEIRIISNLKEKDKVFIINNKLIIDNKEYLIKSYRFHKIYDMVTLEGINDIDEALKLKGLKVFIKRENIDSKFLFNDVIGMEAYDKNKYIGKVVDIIRGKQNLLVIKNNKEFLIPYVKEFIEKIDNNKIYINVIEGLIDEN